MPDSPAQRQQRSKAQPATPSASGAASPGSSQAASRSPQPLAASAPVTPHGAMGDADARESLEVQRPSDVRWLRAVSSTPSSPAAAIAGRWGPHPSLRVTALWAMLMGLISIGGRWLTCMICPKSSRQTAVQSTF